MQKPKLHLCCGDQILDGYLNVDIQKPYDQKIDMNRLPLPFEDNSFDEIKFVNSIMYSTNPYGLITELHRIIKPTGKLILIAPYWNSESARRDLNLRIWGVTWVSFNPFDIAVKETGYLKSSIKFKIKKRIPGLFPSRVANFIGLYVSNFVHSIVFEMHPIKKAHKGGTR